MSSTTDRITAGRATPEPSRDAPPKIRELLSSTQGSAFSRYRRLTHPSGSLSRFWAFELATMLLLPLPGGAGLMLRGRLLRRFFGGFGDDVIIGRNCVFRNPNGIFIGNGVVIDDNCVLDARGAGEQGVRLADGVLLSRGVQIRSKCGPIYVGKDVNIGDYTVIVSQSGVHIGDGAAIAGACQIMGGAFAVSEFTKPAAERVSSSAGPIHIGAGAWLATAALVLDGASVGEDTIVSAGSVVASNVPARCVAQGNPARPVFRVR
ncbi:MAG TPA: acyltransferase [Steroidobacter sp.]|jgi:acetyltransferase-like isoleucine patch superfamily enzyme|nr:acyltransferase [Steroidobacteraceae bacterium]HLS81593.1 acyltransferase [Steroidobacter sp.]